MKFRWNKNSRDDYIGEDYYYDPDVPFIDVKCKTSSGKEYTNKLMFDVYDPEGGNGQPREDMKLIAEYRTLAPMLAKELKSLQWKWNCDLCRGAYKRGGCPDHGPSIIEGVTD